MNRYLLIVATRGYADWGHIPDDEFCSQWGLDKEKDYEWFLKPDDVALLVLHGYKGANDRKRAFDPAQLLQTAAKDKRVKSIVEGKQLIGALFFHHSIGGKPQQKISRNAKQPDIEAKRVKAVKCAVKEHMHTSLDLAEPYHQRGSLAVLELKKDILRSLQQERKQALQLVTAIEMAAAGRTIFVAKLRGIQSALIRLRLLLEVAKTKPTDAKVLKQVRKAGGDLRAAGEGSLGKFKQWLNLIKEREGEHERKATALLSFLGGMEKKVPDDIDPQRAEKTWTDLKNSPVQIVSAAIDPVTGAGVISDIRLFSQAADVLLEASERLPHTIPDLDDDKGRAPQKGDQ